MEALKEVKERLSPRTTPKGWARVRNVCGVLAVIGFYVLVNKMPFDISEQTMRWISLATAIFSAIGGTAHLTKK